MRSLALPSDQTSVGLFFVVTYLYHLLISLFILEIFFCGYYLNCIKRHKVITI